MNDVVQADARSPMADDTMSDDTMIAYFVQLRDLKDKIEKRHTKELEPINRLMYQLRCRLLERLNAGKLMHMASEHGTAYKELTTKTKVVDWEKTLAFIQQGHWDLLERRVSKTAAQAIVEDTKQPIPGVETSMEWVCNVRRS